MEDYLRIGVITSTHGLKGEVKIFPTTDNLKRFNKLKEVFLHNPNSRKQQGFRAIEIEQVRYFKGMVIAKLKDINRIEDAEPYKKFELYIPRSLAEKNLKKGEFFLSDVIGLKAVLEDGNIFGEIVDCYPTGANEIFVIKADIDNEEKEVLLPVIKECVLDIDIHGDRHEEAQVIIRLMDGLI